MPSNNPLRHPSGFPPQAPQGFALWNLGFRPFYLLAALFAASGILTWIAQYAGWTGTATHLSGPLWHAHEMIFGYAFAVVIGFLFTAGHNWTNQPTPKNLRLALIAALWLAARVLAFTPWPMAAAAADTAFALAAAAGLALPLLRSRNRRNYFFVALILLLGAANLTFHLSLAGILDVPVQRGLQLGLDLVLFLMAVMGGRVIPMFTANTIAGANSIRRPWLERFALGSVLALIIADLLALPAILLAVIAGLAALAHALRLMLWHPWLTWRKPLLWILHAAYAWIAIHLALRALAALELIAPNLATHALTVGAIGGMTLGMMMRTSRGHTGRPLEPGRLETLSLVLVQLAALLRVLLPLAAPQLYIVWIILSGLFWSVAFTLFSILYWPILMRPRIDGRFG